MNRVQVPATNRAPAATVEISAEGTVTLDGKLIGHVWKGEYSYSPKAAGHGGKVVRYHSSVGEWCAADPVEAMRPSYQRHVYQGGIFPSHYRKNTRKAALAYLVAVAHGADSPSYFNWERV